MIPEDWERLKQLFERALGLSTEERLSFVRKVRLDNEADGLELAKLLKAQDEISTVDAPLVKFHESFPSEERFFRENELVLERFRIVRFLGKGGMGEVYEADDLHLGRVALKAIRPELAANREILLRFSQEVQLARKVTNVHVCRIHELFTVSATGLRPASSFLTMELLNGATLAHSIENEGPLPVPEAESVALQLCSALQAIHDAGIVHRDFKSNNVMLVPRNGVTHAVVMDLGLAREAAPALSRGAGLTGTGAIMGTPEYMAPEQFEAQAVTPATDIYALGVVLYEMVTGSLPFQASALLAAAILRTKRPCAVSSIRPDIPPRWDEVISRCLEYEREERFQSANEVATALRPALLPALVASDVLPGRRRRLGPASISLALAIAIAFGCAVWAYRQRIPNSTGSEQRVAVLEFENIGGGPVNQAFCDGLMETVTSKLTELEQFQGSLSVVPASDVRKEKVTSAREAKREFGVNLVITGSVQHTPNGLRLIVNLVDAGQLKQLRSHGILVPETDAISMQQGVITQITDLLNIQLRPDAQRRLAEGETPVPGAYDFYLQGSGYLLAGRGAADQAIAEFQHALDRDPNYALAHAGLGEAYWNKYLATRDQQWIDRAWRECKRSIELGPQIPAAHVTLALVNSGTGHYDEAIRQSQEAIRIDPGDDRAYAELARALDATSQPEAAEATLKKAIALRPSYWNNYVRLGIFYNNHGRYRDALAPFTRVIELVPDNPVGYTDLGSIYHVQGRESEAEQMLKKSIQVRPTAPAYSNLATVYFFQRRYADAVPIFEKLIADGTKSYAIWGNLGDAYRWTPGNTERAVRAYRNAIDLAAQAVGVNRRDARALISLALYRAKVGQSAQAVRDMKKALIYASDDKIIFFNATIICELASNRVQALKYLGRAVSGGYSLNEIATEPELGKLRQDPSYEAVISHNNGR